MPFESLFKDFSRSENCLNKAFGVFGTQNCVGDSWTILHCF